MTKRILITGGAGFIGINTAARFIKRGYGVTIFDNLSRKGVEHNLIWLNQEYPGKFNFIKGDIRHDLGVLSQEISRHDFVFHLAAQVAVTSSILNPHLDFETNVLGTLNVLELVRQSSNRPAIIYSSTNKVYGDLEWFTTEEGESRYSWKNYPQGVAENTLLDFHSPYGCSKGAADQYVHDYSRIYGLKTVVLRQSCIYGYHQFGIEDQGWVAWFITALLLGKPLTLYGNGKQVRDVLFIDDLTKLYETIVDDIGKISGKIYNVGGGADNAISLLELLNVLKARYGLDANYTLVEPRAGDQKVFISNNQALEKDLNWKPATGITEGLDKIVFWLKDNLPIIKLLYQG